MTTTRTRTRRAVTIPLIAGAAGLAAWVCRLGSEGAMVAPPRTGPLVCCGLLHIHAPKPPCREVLYASLRSRSMTGPGPTLRLGPPLQQSLNVTTGEFF